MKVKSLGMMIFTLLMTVLFTIGGTTLAIFTSSAENSGNVAHAGTINLSSVRDHGDYVPGPMFYPDRLDPSGNHPYDKSKVSPPSGETPGGWAPGDTVTRTMILVNNGTLDAKVTGIKAIPRSSYTQGYSTVDGLISGAAYHEFIQKANVKVMLAGTDIVLYNGPLSGLLVTGDGYAPVSHQLVLMGTSPPQHPGPLNITFEVHLDNSAGNDVQGETFIFDFGFLAEQVRNNDGTHPVEQSGTISGTITNAVTNQAVSGVSLSFRSGSGSQTGAVVATAVTQPDGRYSINLPAGSYTAQVSHDGYITTFLNVTSVANQETPEQNTSISPLLAEGQTRIVLTWAAQPQDLDSILTGQLSNGDNFILYYLRTTIQDNNGETIATLDRDDQDGYGPETVTVTINNAAAGDYHYIVQTASTESSITRSEAVVRVFQNNALVATYNVPTSRNGYTWNVFNIHNGAIVPVNTIR